MRDRGQTRGNGATLGKSGLLGLSATELLVTVLIMMILAVAGAAGYRVYQRESPLRYGAARLARAAQAARSYAVANNTPYALQIHPKYQNYWIDELDPNDTTVIAVSKVVAPETIGEKIRWVAAEVDGVQIQLTSTTLNQSLPIRFFPDGQCDDARLVLQLGDNPGSAFAAVRIYGPTGLARVKDDVQAPTQTLTGGGTL